MRILACAALLVCCSPSATTVESPSTPADNPSTVVDKPRSVGTTAVADSARGDTGALPPASDDHYGIYLNGSKVGWMRTTMTVANEVVMTTQLRASVRGLNRVSEIKLDERRSYDVASRGLQEISFEQGAQTGSTRAEGRARGSKLELTITSGGESSKREYSINDTLDGALATWRLARGAKVGATASSERFDASIQRAMKATHRVAAVETKVFAGVTAKVVRIETDYPDQGIKESAWIDANGRVMESRMGGFFVARLESEAEAKRLDYSQDILVSAVVKSPTPINDAESITAMELEFLGFGEQLPPVSPRQGVRRKGDGVVLSLKRDTPPVGVPLGGVAPDDAYLQPTPFIQSESPEVRAKAKEVIGDAEDLYTATTRLSSFVFSHVEDEYVPAYSNALEALRSGRGDCTEHAILFVALARAAGIPARVAVGIGYWPPGDGFGWHAWAEVRAKDQWYAVDPTWDQPIADATHIKLADGGPAEQARIVMLLGSLKITRVSM